MPLICANIAYTQNKVTKLPVKSPVATKKKLLYGFLA